MNTASVLSVLVEVKDMQKALGQIDNLEGRMDGAAAAAGKAADDMAAAGASGGQRFAQDAVQKLNGLDGDMKRVADAAGAGASRELAAAGDKGGEAFVEGAGSHAEKLKDVFKGGAAAAGTLAAGALAYGIKSALDVGSSRDKLAAQLGLTEEDSARIGKVAGDLYANNYGESLGQVNDALHGVIQNVDGMRSASSKDLEEVSGKVLNLAQTFDQDLGGTTAAVGQMMKTGLAKDADEALDVLTVGFQNGANKADDLLDTMNEYGGQFEKLGLDGATATGIISQGLQGGARDADLVADALKEFSIRAIDGSKTTSAGFDALGLSADKMSSIIAGGGPKAARGLDTVLDRLRGVEDPTKRAQIAVELFGTQAEDLGGALYAIDPSKAVKGLGEIGGAADKMGDTLSGNASAKIETFKRQALQKLTEIVANDVIPALERVGPIAEDVADWVGGMFAKIDTKKLGDDVESVRTIFTDVAAFVKDLAEAVGPGVEKMLGGALEVISGILTIVSGLLSGDFSKAWEGAKKVIHGAAQYIVGELTVLKDTVGDLIRQAIGKVISAITDKLSDVYDATQRLVGKITGAIGDKAADFIDSGKGVVGKVREGIRSVESFAGDVGGWIKNRVVEGIHDAADGITAVGGWVTNRVGDGLRAVTDFAGSVGGWIKNRVGEGVRSEVEGISEVGGWITGKVVSGVKSVGGVAADIGGWVKDKVEAIPGVVGGAAKSAGEAIMKAVASGLTGAKDLARSAVRGVIDAVNDAIPNKIPLPGLPDINVKDDLIPYPPGFANGVRGFAGGWAMVGEKGAELVRLPGGSDVFSNSESKAMLAPSAGPALAGHAPARVTVSPTFRIYVGSQEITDIVRVEIEERDRESGAVFNAGALT